MTSENNTVQETDNDVLKKVGSFLMRVFLLAILFVALKLVAGAIYGFYQFLTEMPFV